jgi:hypothetical protein
MKIKTRIVEEGNTFETVDKRRNTPIKLNGNGKH